MNTTLSFMWFYLYLLTVPFYDKMGFHMWGYTTNQNLSIDNLTNHVEDIYPMAYCDAVYKMPNKFIAFPFHHVIAPPRYHMVRDDKGWEWYKISPSHLELIFSNASIPAERIHEYEWNHTEL